ncbi:MAG: hypothetical protein ACLQVY_02705 [Limisphaerales bacterium]
MKSLVSHLLIVVATAIAACAQSAPPLIPTNAPPLIELRDQFDAPQKLSFPTTNVTLLTIADKKGSVQIAAWITPLRQRFGTNIDIRGMADVSKVPRALQGLVRTRFQALLTYPVMMDWSGGAVSAFTYVPGQANVLVLDGGGQILMRISGKADTKSLQNLCVAINRALVNRREKPSTP